MKATKDGFEVETNRDQDTLTFRVAGSSISIPRLTLTALFREVEKDLGPTLQEYFDAGYNPANYPPFDYSPRPFAPGLMAVLVKAHEARRA